MLKTLKPSFDPPEPQSEVHQPRYLALGTKRLKLTPLVSIIKEAEMEHLKAVLKVPPGAKAQNLIETGRPWEISEEEL